MYCSDAIIKYYRSTILIRESRVFNARATAFNVKTQIQIIGLDLHEDGNHGSPDEPV